MSFLELSIVRSHTRNFEKRLTQKNKNLKSSTKLKNIIKCKLVGENGDKVAQYWKSFFLGHF